MASLPNVALRCSLKAPNLSIRYSLLVRKWCSIAHTINVQERIKRKRQEALLGGGPRRIDAQHKKVT